MKVIRQFYFLIPFILLASAGNSFSQSPNPQAATSAAGDTVAAVAISSPTPVPSPTPRINFFRNVAHDQKAIWLSPFRLKRGDAKLVFPIALGAAALIATDRKTSAWVDRNGTLPAASRDVSFVGSAYVTASAAAGFYLIGRAAHNRKAQDTGTLAAEALLDSTIVAEVLKFGLGRQRPNEGTGRGLFFKGGRSFPSGHSTAGWAVATVIAYRYKDHPLIKYGAFALAAAISLSRYSGRNHFLSDIVAGSAIGFGIGRYVYASHP